MEQSIKDILQTIDGAIKSFNSKIPGVQKIMIEELMPLIKDLQVKDGRLLNNLNNLKLIGAIQNKLEKIILTAEYKKSVSKFIESFGAISELNNSYFAQFNKKYTPKNTLPIIRQLAIETTITDLIGEGMKSNIISPVKSILQQNVTSGGNYAQFTEEVRNYIKGTGNGDGVLERYAGQIAKDAINQYNAQYHDAIAQDLNFDWGRYVGSNLTTTRQFCELLTAKEWVHKSELPEIIKGTIDGEKLKLSKSTKLPLGMIPGTNVENFKIRRGGYNCGHQFFWVPDSSVPAHLLAKFPRTKV